MNGVLDLRYRARYCILTTKQKRGITFALKRSVFPGGESFTRKQQKQQGAAFFLAAGAKNKQVYFLAFRQKRKDTDMSVSFVVFGWRREGDSNPRNPKRVQRFSRPPRSTAPASLRVSYLFLGLAKVINFIFWRKTYTEISAGRQLRR